MVESSINLDILSSIIFDLDKISCLRYHPALDNMETFKKICRENGITGLAAARQLRYSYEHLSRVLTGKATATDRMRMFLLAWSGGRIDTGDATNKAA